MLRGVQKFFDFEINDFRSNCKFFFVILILKIIVLLGIYRIQINPNYWGIANMYGDSYSYIRGYENLLTQGEYGLPIRMPFVGLIYFLARIFYSQNTSASIQVIFQILLNVLATLLLGRLAYEYTKKKISFYLAIFFSIIFLRISYYDITLLSESQAYSFSIIFIYFYFHYLKNKRRNYLLYAVLSLNFLVGLKNYFFLLYVFLCIIDIQLFSFRNLKIWLISFVIFFFPWMIRNFIKYEKIIPFQMDTKGGYEISFSENYMDIISLFGYTYDFYFFLDSKEKNDPKFQVQFLEYLLKNNHLLDEEIKEEIDSLYLIIENKKITKAIELSENNEYNRALKKIKNILVQKNKFRLNFYTIFIKGHAKNSIKLIFTRIVNIIPNANFFVKLIKLINVLLYFLLLGFYLFYYFFFEKDYLMRILFCIPIYLFVFFTFIISREEHRYFYLSYPTMIVVGIKQILKIKEYLNQNNL